jgi:hypothetical protein
MLHKVVFQKWRESVLLLFNLYQLYGIIINRQNCNSNFLMGYWYVGMFIVVYCRIKLAIDHFISHFFGLIKTIEL